MARRASTTGTEHGADLASAACAPAGAPRRPEPTPPRPLPPWLRRALPALVVAWIGAIAVGVYTCHGYETAVGAVGHAPPTWPAASIVGRATDGTTAIMFVHPECPCTHASLAELSEARRLAGAGTIVVVIEPALVRGDDAAAWDRAGEIAGVVRIRDDGTEARRFGAETSGHTVVYDRAGRLQFAGGITGSRGHAGDNVGRAAVVDLLRGGPSPYDRHAVFGCAMAEAR